jgi:hypothetical protein
LPFYSKFENGKLPNLYCGGEISQISGLGESGSTIFLALEKQMCHLFWKGRHVKDEALKDEEMLVGKVEVAPIPWTLG